MGNGTFYALFVIKRVMVRTTAEITMFNETLITLETRFAPLTFLAILNIAINVKY